MAVLPIVEIPDPRLRLISKPVESITDETRAFVQDMIDTMYAAHGIGLAAIQVGVDQRILVIDLQEEKDEDDKPIKAPKAYINPEVLSVSDETSTYNEGCLSIPEQYADVQRPASCRVRWQDETGAAHEEELTGLLATCMQHEIDHLNGVLFIDHISRLKRDMVLKKLAKARR
ncbi:peptide deformylase [Sphingomonas melonis TY]|jgi:peptide deformylase|uniref:Peptide deformylase n=1 Tax=Sphingomonas melonis TY TaxID=621456 RepID=A0A154NB30_9SPHN|nr:MULTISPECIES: peptide deformylase [Sphingomonas]AOW23727.1 peptide deformylase [Sphingomonas melonis TY]ATI54733.1 peptide deformylase [Sphingomonas melonis]KZB96886.1 peptide deformylase [Sphingomonas melonis TY]MBI0531205.1 peptide deformylase [Sphingomonas sp. TX0522]MBX8846211.1 peptide deformylase [Sphingomonas melonis]